jgi:hypothetical protein
MPPVKMTRTARIALTVLPLYILLLLALLVVRFVWMR